MQLYIQASIVLGLLFIIFIFTASTSVMAVLTTLEWVTTYILPWIALYWFIQFVKAYKERTK
ncbi:hypothetical protein ACFO3D_12445 [Virgibacillus kekensis]|uniref:Uncharacterized protein n=1 Tax=Virgibacillus kekensis TaxID=202261 RepID=A0ABV9DN51_9BACI